MKNATYKRIKKKEKLKKAEQAINDVKN